ncbi:multidrug efflux SMR transporter [Kiloniella laminariae]|uniref:Multidrug efflux SMR transporter n=1 Tax=Kiloniella laminariae TaxID=454162 RepID=A0ABT4LEN5_9PROT|nr:multidrug efflux SMR transporter [Kiloniella laminariae]MCZ4279558.1 multidrug efflux SMR transporter [Kiloniella laminariae]
MSVYWMLGIAIVCEVIATLSLKLTDGFTRPWPTLVVAVGYICAFYLLSLVTRQLSIGVTYAVWSGAGIVLTAGFGIVFFGEKMDLAGGVGIAMIIGGVLLLNLVSKASGH